ncbi:hypothetical protein L2E82_17124 [Cichorium intybus]|uniref:Uncharacterized protein n=1 Tax=Cichorium intybus TaxID=13427 RepID=A0ACB9F8D3_CICIN|nr:hypothetical protein L2E82_17124 [Cichorium intybus]
MQGLSVPQVANSSSRLSYGEEQKRRGGDALSHKRSSRAQKAQLFQITEAKQTLIFPQGSFEWEGRWNWRWWRRRTKAIADEGTAAARLLLLPRLLRTGG